MTENTIQVEKILEKLPGLNCGLCGFRTCEEFARTLVDDPKAIERCVNLSQTAMQEIVLIEKSLPKMDTTNPCDTCSWVTQQPTGWTDFLGRDYDFILQTFPNEPGPRETILPHNPMLTRELEITRGEVLIGRPLGMSCGCPITHSGIVMDVDKKTGVIVWCVTGPLQPRMKGYKDLGYYAAEAYEGLVKESKKDLRVGMRYWFLPRKCMLQWRHSGLINFMTRTGEGTQVRIEGLMIG